MRKEEVMRFKIITQVKRGRPRDKVYEKNRRPGFTYLRQRKNDKWRDGQHLISY